MTSSTLQDRFINPNQTVEEQEKKQLLGSQLLDNITASLTGVGQSIVKASEDDPDEWTDDAIRLGLGGAKNVGNVLNAPGIKQALQVLGAPTWIVGQGLGWTLEKAGVDPRYGHIVGEIGEWFIPFYGASKLLKKTAQGTKLLTKARHLNKYDDAVDSFKTGQRYMEQEFDLPENVLQRVLQTPEQASYLKTRIVNAIDGEDLSKARRLQRDEFSKVSKERIKNLVEEFGGSSSDVERIYKDELVRHSKIKQSVAWLNRYFEDLTTELDDLAELKNLNIANVNGKPTLVDRASNTPKSYRWAFEKDHSKARAIFEDLGIPGADFSDNLDIVYTVFNQAKSDIAQIPDEISRAIGRSTSLREFIQRQISKEFDAKFQRVPQQFRRAAEIRMLDAVQNSIPIKGKPKKMLKQIVEENLKFWDEFAEPLMQMADDLPPAIQEELDNFFRRMTPETGLENLESLGVWEYLGPTIKKRYIKKAINFQDLHRGLGARREMKKKYYRQPDD